MLQNVTAAPLLVVHHVEEEQSWTEEVSACLSPDWDVGEDIGNVSRLGFVVTVWARACSWPNFLYTQATATVKVRRRKQQNTMAMTSMAVMKTFGGVSVEDVARGMELRILSDQE